MPLALVGGHARLHVESDTRGPVNDIDRRNRRNRPNRRGALGCLLLVLLLAAALTAFVVWAWNQPGGNTPSYWH